jgi:acetyltransferase
MAPEAPTPSVRPHPFERVFAPRAIAVFGAAEADSAGARVLRNVVAGGFPGAVHAIGGVGGEGLPGVRSWGSLAEVEGEVDLAVVASPPAALPAAVRACAERGVGGAVIPVGASGSAAGGVLDEGAARALLDAARGGLRLLGPNSVGLIRPGARLNATFTNGSASPGSLGLVSQSGAVCATALDWAAAHRVGFSTVVSLGDALDVDFGEVLEYLALDAATKSVLLYVETVRSARAFLSGLRLAARLKPVVVVKAGRHGPPGARSSDDAFDAALARTGAVRVTSIDRMFAAARLLATPRAVSGNRLAILTNARGPGLLAADRAADLGVAVPPLADATREALLPLGISPSNPLDLLADADPARYGAAVQLCLADPGVDAVLAMLAPQALARPAESAEAVVAASRGKAKPIVACWMGEELVRSAHARFVEAGLPAFAAPESAVEAFGLLASYARNQRLLRQVPGPLAADAVPRLDRAREIVAGALARGRHGLTTAELQRLLAAIGVRDRGAAGQRVRGTELYVGVARDAVFGPVIRFGRGGAGGLAGEPVVALPPLDTAIIQTLVRTSRDAPAFTAAGGMSGPEVAACERTLWALSELVSELPELRELEISPLLVAGGEVYASGARAAIAPPAAGAGRYDHMAIHPYPSHLVARWRLPGGDTVTVRPIRPEDADMEASFVRNLSDAARHFRFMTTVKELTREMLVRFTQIDYDRELALVALVEQGGKETQIAVARYVMSDRERADVAIVVSDAWQGRGIGARLLGMLLEAARARGIVRLEGEVLAENAAIRALLARLGFTFRRDPESADLLLIEKTLAGAAAGR